MNDPMILITGEELTGLRKAFTRRPRPHTVRVWFDPIDRAVKFKFDNGTWSPPMGIPEIT